jgi:predicted ATP-grasp superfamily ATP-dependent carboligase
MGIREWDGNDPLKPSEILEEFIEGTLGSACFVADGEKTVVLGLTRQYAGVSELGAPPFVWCGNVTDFEDAQLSDRITNAIQRIVSVFGLIGLNGIDYINKPLGPVLLEINPRPPASFELFERLLGINAFQLHKDSYRGILPEKLPLPHSGEVWGKGILYANRELRIANYIFKNSDNIVDIPHPGEIIPIGAPICTILTRDNNQSACWKQIIEKIDDLRVGLSI